MNKDINSFGFPPETTDWVEAFLSSVGRLLALASDFHFHCNAMAESAGLLEQTSGGSSILDGVPDELFDGFLKALTSDENMDVIRAVDSTPVNPDELQSLVAWGWRAFLMARGELTAGLKHTSAHEEGRKELLRDLKKSTHTLAEADRFVATLVVSALGGQPPSRSEYAGYVEQAEQWVLEPVQGLGDGSS